MINQQLADFIKQSLQKGSTKEKISGDLLANNWTAQDIEEGFNSINISTSAEQYSNFSTKAPIKMWKIIMVSLLGVVVIGGGIYFFTQFFDSKGTLKSSNELTNQSPINNQTVETTTTPELSTKQPEEIKKVTSSDTFPDKLNSCTKYKTDFIHLFTGETLEKEILGLINGKCNYVEQMPNGGKMECKFTESMKIAVAKYYKDVAVAESVGTSVNADMESGKQKTTYTIDGKVVENPLQEAIENGVCVISGY